MLLQKNKNERAEWAFSRPEELVESGRLLYYCFTTALLLLYYCFNWQSEPPFAPKSLLNPEDCFTTALLLLYYCFTTALTGRVGLLASRRAC
jgi:hypothetical protein